MGIPTAKPNCKDLFESFETIPLIIPGSAEGGDVEWSTNVEALVIVLDTDAEAEGVVEGFIEENSETDDLMVAIAVTKVVVM